MVNGAPNRAVCRFKEAEQYLPYRTVSKPLNFIIKQRVHIT